MQILQDMRTITAGTGCRSVIIDGIKFLILMRTALILLILLSFIVVYKHL